MALAPFHLAIPVYDLAAARHFYGEVFGCAEGRSSDHWVDFDFFGHQLVIHQAPKMAHQEAAHSNPVDGHDVAGAVAVGTDAQKTAFDSPFLGAVRYSLDPQWAGVHA